MLGAGVRFVVAGGAMLAVPCRARAPRARVEARAGRCGAHRPAAARGRQRRRHDRRAERPQRPGGAAHRLRPAVDRPAALDRRAASASRAARSAALPSASPAWRSCWSPAAARRTRPSPAWCSCFSRRARGPPGSFLSPRLPMPSDGLVSTAWQMMFGGIALLIGAFAAGEQSDLHLADASAKSLFALAYLVVAGLVGRLHRLRLAAAERAGVAGGDLRLRQPARGRRPRLGDPRRAS